jgi:hypothetical protein
MPLKADRSRCPPRLLRWKTLFATAALREDWTTRPAEHSASFSRPMHVH